MALEFSIISSGSPALDVPDLSDGQVGHATAVGDGLHLLGDVLLTRALNVDVEAVWGGVVTGNGLSEVVSSVQPWTNIKLSLNSFFAAIS